jgi:hypothetical protein
VRRKNHFLPGQYGLIIRWLFCSCIFSFLQRSHEVREIERERARVNWVWYRTRVSRLDVEFSSWLWGDPIWSQIIKIEDTTGISASVPVPSWLCWQIASCTACAVVHPDLLWEENCSQNWKACHDLLVCIGNFCVFGFVQKMGESQNWPCH